MKRNLLCLVMGLFALAVMAQTTGSGRVEVLYFHGKQRCVTCMAIEKQAREVVEQTFANEQKAGKVRFRVVDIFTPEGKKMAKEYRVSWSSLYVNGWNDGKEKRNDLTQFAFKNARNHAEVFKKGVSEKIQELLK